MLVRSLGRLVTLAAACSLTLLVPVSTGAYASAHSPRTTEAIAGTEESAPERAEPLEVLFAPTETLLNPLDAVEMRVQVRNNTDEDVGTGIIDLLLNPDPVQDVHQLVSGAIEPDLATGERPEADELSPENVEYLGTVEIPEVAANGAYSTTLTIDADEFPLDFLAEPGVYLAEARYKGVDADFNSGLRPAERETPAQTRVNATAPVVWRGLEANVIAPISPVIPLVFPVGDDTPLTPADLESRVGDGSRVDRLLGIAEAYDATIAVDPKIIAAVRAFGGEASDEARAVVERITSGGTASAALQYADADPAIQAALGVDELLAPAGLSHLTRFFTPLPQPDEPEGTEDPAPTETSDATRPSQTGSEQSEAHDRLAQPVSPASPAVGEETDAEESGARDADAQAPDAEENDESTDDNLDPILRDVPPSLDELLDWQPTIEGFSWPATDALTPEALLFLQQQGFSSLLVSGTAASGPAAATLGEMTAYRSNSALEEYASAYLDAESVTDEEHARAMLAALTLLGEVEPQTADGGADGTTGTRVLDPTILTLEREVISAAPEPEQLFEFLFDLPWVESEALPEPSEQALVLDKNTPDEARVQQLSDALERAEDVEAHARVLVNPEYLVDYQRDRLLTFLSPRLAEQPTAFSELAETHVDVDRMLANGIAIVDTEHTRLIGSSSRIPVQLRNTLPFDAVVTGRLSATSAALTIEEPQIEETVIEAEGSTNHLVPVLARVSNGDSGLLVTLHDTHAAERITSRQLEITIQSDVEIIALGTLASLAVMLFGFGTFRSIRRHRAHDNTVSDGSRHDTAPTEATTRDER